MIRRTITVVLLSIFAIEAGGAIAGLQLRQWLHKISVATIIEHGDLPTEIVAIVLTRAEFDKIKVHEREFRLNGQMFDVVWRETNGDTLQLYCYRDNAEEKLIAKILGFIARKTDDTGTPIVQTMHSIPAGFVLSVPDDTEHRITIPSYVLAPDIQVMVPIHRTQQTDIPPPKFSLV